MRPIARGDRGKEVVDIQMRLSGIGYSLGREGADGYFGQQSERAIKGFQQERLLAVDGVVGENTGQSWWRPVMWKATVFCIFAFPTCAGTMFMPSRVGYVNWALITVRRTALSGRSPRMR